MPYSKTKTTRWKSTSPQTAIISDRLRSIVSQQQVLSQPTQLMMAIESRLAPGTSTRHRLGVVISDWHTSMTTANLHNIHLCSRTGQSSGHGSSDSPTGAYQTTRSISLSPHPSPFPTTGTREPGSPCQIPPDGRRACQHRFPEGTLTPGCQIEAGRLSGVPRLMFRSYGQGVERPLHVQDWRLCTIQGRRPDSFRACGPYLRPRQRQGQTHLHSTNTDQAYKDST